MYRFWFFQLKRSDDLLKPLNVLMQGPRLFKQRCSHHFSAQRHNKKEKIPGLNSDFSFERKRPPFLNQNC